MERLLAGTTRNYLPSDWQQLAALLERTSTGYGALSSELQRLVNANAILTPQMREANPDKAYRTFTSVEDIADAIAFICSDSAAKMTGKRLSLYP